MLGRHRKALARLGRLFATGAVEKVYWAIVEGRPPAPSGTVELPLRKRSERRGWWMETAADGQTARTDYRLLGEAPGLSWLECRPRTGRTHQIRVHCAAVGCPVRGDAVYGATVRGDGPPLQLHARAVALPLYPGKPPITIAASPPAHMLEALRLCGYDEAVEPPSPVAAAPTGERRASAGRERCSA